MMVGVVYGIDNTVHQVIIPDTDKQLQDPAWVAGGKTMRLVSKTYYESFPNIFDFIASLGLHSSSPWDGA